MLPAPAIDDHSELPASASEGGGAEVVDLVAVRQRRSSPHQPKCAHCRAPIPAGRSSRALYCRDACRMAAASARRRWQRQQYVARTVLAPPPAAPRSRPHPAIALLVGLGRCHRRLRCAPTNGARGAVAEADAKAALELRERLADATVGPGLAFWQPLCSSHSPMCTAYVAGFVAANAFLREPLFCPQGLEISQIEERFAADLQWAADKPEVFAARPGTFAAAVLNFAMPCGAKTLVEKDDEEKQKATKPGRRHHEGPHP
jgi:hypothetical protein